MLLIKTVKKLLIFGLNKIVFEKKMPMMYTILSSQNVD